MRDNRAIAITAGAVLLGSTLAIGFCLSGGFGPVLEPGPFREAGRVLAQQTLSRLKPGGTVTVITRDTLAFQNPASDVLLASFRRELSNAKVKIDSLQTIQVDPLRQVTVPPGDFQQWIKNSNKGSVIASFMGPPILNPAQLAQLGEIKPSIIALCSGSTKDQVDLRALFSQGLLAGAVVTRRPVLVRAQRPASDKEAFDREFVAITSETLGALPAMLNSSP